MSVQRIRVALEKRDLALICDGACAVRAKRDAVMPAAHMLSRAKRYAMLCAPYRYD